MRESETDRNEVVSGNRCFVIRRSRASSDRPRQHPLCFCISIERHAVVSFSSFCQCVAFFSAVDILQFLCSLASLDSSPVQNDSSRVLRCNNQASRSQSALSTQRSMPKSDFNGSREIVRKYSSVNR